MTPRRFYLVVEGRGEVKAALNLINRLWIDLGLSFAVWRDPPLRGEGKLKVQRGVLGMCDILRKHQDCAGALFLRDEDDLCPKSLGPMAAGWLREAALPFPAAFVLVHREFESLFLPCLHRMAGRRFPDGREGVREGASFVGLDPEKTQRDVKGLITTFYRKGRAYKPTLDQLPLTQMIDFDTLRAAQPPLPCFGTLERALRWLDTASGGTVYPPTSAP